MHYFIEEEEEEEEELLYSFYEIGSLLEPIANVIKKVLRFRTEIMYSHVLCQLIVIARCNHQTPLLSYLCSMNYP